MPASSSNTQSERVLIHAPFGRDGRMIGQVLQNAGIEAIVCSAWKCLLGAIPCGAGVLLLGDEALSATAVADLSALLEAQPKWSDLPVLVLTSGGETTNTSRYRLHLLDPLGNVSLLERPLRTVTLLSAVKTALRARRRQYEISVYLEERDDLLKQVREREGVYRAIGESIDFGIWVAGKDGRNLYVSESFLKLLGMTQEEYSSKGWENALHPDEAVASISAWKDCVENGCFWDRVHRVRGTDGAWHPVLARGVPIRNENGEILYWAGINLDISREQEAARALEASNESLSRSNSDLEQFAYAASHDLQEPLRNVIIYSQLLAENFPEKLEGEARNFLSTIVGSASRMEMLIRGLLSYTRATTADDEVSAPVNAGAVLCRVLQDMNGSMADSGAKVSYDALPSLMVNELHLRQLFQNLIGNAIKYRSEAAPRIHISVSRGPLWLFTVSDNGIGIEPQYTRQIFGVFKRLHNIKEYPGAGIGLAVCQKIIERYGGQIWVESEPGKGSDFKFTLPVAAE